MRRVDPRIALSILFAGLCLPAGTELASAVVYCTYINYPANCVVRPGVRLVARPVARPVARAAVPGTPGNRNGGVNRVGRVR
jgi:hypothetical protein